MTTRHLSTKITRNELLMLGISAQWVRDRYRGLGSMEASDLAKRAHVDATELIRQKGYDGEIFLCKKSIAHRTTAYRPITLAVLGLRSEHPAPPHGRTSIHFYGPEDGEFTHQAAALFGTRRVGGEEVQGLFLEYNKKTAIAFSRKAEGPTPVQWEPFSVKKPFKAKVFNPTDFYVDAQIVVWGVKK